MVKRIFGVSNSLSKGIRDTLNAVENNLSNFRFNIVKLSEIDIDPENPRDLSLTIEDIKEGKLKQTDSLYYQKKEEYASLQTLATTIKSKGLINPIVLYKYENRYRLIAGERRYLAAHIANKEDIQARILLEKPSLYDLKLLQWIENNERQDLSLRERLNNIRSIMDAYKIQFSTEKITASIIKEATGLSLPQATYYHQVLQAPKDVFEAIEKNQIKNLDKAVIISSIQNNTDRERAIDLCRQGATLKQLKNMIVTEKALKEFVGKKRGRISRTVKLGSTTNLNVVKVIIQQILKLPELKSHIQAINERDLSDYREVTRAFNELLIVLEATLGNDKKN